MPFLTDLLYSGNKDNTMFSFDALMNQIKYNLIIANYGAGWGVDSKFNSLLFDRPFKHNCYSLLLDDDGSSFYDIFDNVFLDSNGFKV